MVRSAHIRCGARITVFIVQASRIAAMRLTGMNGT